MESLQTFEGQAAAPNRALKLDVAVLNAAAKGNAQACEMLIATYQSHVQRRCLRRGLNGDDAQDVTQDIFIKVLRNLPRYEHQNAFDTWLNCVTDHACIDHYRRRKRQLAVMQPMPVSDEGRELEVAGRIANPDAQYDEESMGMRIQQALASLSPILREAFEMKELEGLRYERIAERLNVTLGTVKSRIHRARLLLTDALQDLL